MHTDDLCIFLLCLAVSMSNDKARTQRDIHTLVTWTAAGFVGFSSHVASTFNTMRRSKGIIDAGVLTLSSTGTGACWSPASSDYHSMSTFHSESSKTIVPCDGQQRRLLFECTVEPRLLLSVASLLRVHCRPHQPFVSFQGYPCVFKEWVRSVYVSVPAASCCISSITSIGTPPQYLWPHPNYMVRTHSHCNGVTFFNNTLQCRYKISSSNALQGHGQSPHHLSHLHPQARLPNSSSGSRASWRWQPIWAIYGYQCPCGY